MKKTLMDDARPTESQEEWRSLFSFPLPSPRRLLVATSFSLGIALALLILSLPDASAQQNPARNPDKDIATSGLGLSNKNPRGIWVDEEKQVLLVLDYRYRKIFTYCFDTGRRLDDHTNDRVKATATDLETAAKKAEVNKDDFFLFNDSAPIVVGEDSSEDLKRRYPGATTAANSKRFYPYQENNKLLLPNPYGIWANGTTDGATLWVSDFDNDKIYAYDLTWHQSPVYPNDSTKKYAKGTRASGKDVITLHSQNKKPHGIWVHGGIMWIADNGADKIFAYDWPSKTHNPSRDILLTHKNAYAQGIWSDGTTLWVANIEGIRPGDEQRIYAYDITSKARDPRKDFTALSGAGNDRPRGIWSDGEETMWVADQTDNKIYAYHFDFTSHPNRALDFDTLKDAGNTKPKGMWSDGETMWVADASEDKGESKAKLYAYDFFTKERLPDKEFGTLVAAGNHDPTDIWSDGTTMWIADYEDDKLYAYNLETKARDAGKDLTLAAGNDQPTGIWSDGTTMWVADTTEDDKVYAYKMADKSRDSTKDINVKALLPHNPYLHGIWSDGTTMWVADFISKIYAFTLPVEEEDENGVKSVRAASRVEAKDLPVLALANKKAFGLWSDETTMWVADDAAANDKIDSKIYAYRLSDAASLGALKLTGHVPSPEYKDFDVELKINDEPKKPFNSGITRYTASVPYATASLTIEPTPLRTGDVDSILPADSSATEGHQVNLAVGENTISITVDTAATDTTSRPQTRTYTVEITREFFTYNDPSKTIALAETQEKSPTDLELKSNDNSDPRGIWANETTIWVADSEDDKLYAYTISTKLRDAGKDIPLVETQEESPTDLELKSNDNSAPRGIWSDETTMWVADSEDDKLYAYTISTKLRDAGKDIPLVEANANPQWIWSDGAATMWVTDNAGTSKADDDKIFAYEMSGDKDQLPSRDIDLGELVKDNNAHSGIWSDGANLWVANNDINNAKIYSYKLAVTGIDCREETKDFNTLEDANNHNPKAIFSDGTTMYVADSEDDKIYAYNQPLSGNAWLKTLRLSGDVFYGTQPFQLSNPTTDYKVWVDRSTESRLRTTITAEAQDPNAVSVKITPEDTDANTTGHQIALSAGSNEIKITVTAENGVIDKLYTVNIHRINNDRRIPPLDFELEGGNADPTSIWADGETMWVVDNSDKTVYAYKMSGKEWAIQNDDKTFPFSTQSLQGDGIWGNETTIWVSDRQINKLFAYQNEESADGIFGNPDVAGDFTTLRSDNVLSPRGLWGDGTTVWVANKSNNLYAYKLTDENRNSGKDVALSDIDDNSGAPSIWDFWANESTIWVVNNSDRTKLYAYKRSGTDAKDANGKQVRDSGKDITLSTDNGNPKGIWSNGTVMWVSDEDDGEIYAYRMPTASGAAGGSDFFFSEDSTLKALQLSGATLTPAFSADNRHYTALVDHTVHTATVTATPNDSMAAVDIFSGGRGTTRKTARKGPQVSLEEGYNIIAIDVTAESRTAQSTYIIEVTKSEAPPVSGGPLPQPQSFQTSSALSQSQTDLASSAIAIGEWKSRLILAESLLNGGVRFVFAVPAVEEFGIEESPDLPSREWRPLLDDEFKATRESNVDGPDRLTIILPKTEGKQRFFRLTPQR